MGLGNIVDLLLLGKIIFLNKKGIVYKTLTDKGVSVYDCNQTKDISLENLIELKEEHNLLSGVNYAKGLRNKQFVINDWVELLKYLKVENGR